MTLWSRLLAALGWRGSVARVATPQAHLPAERAEARAETAAIEVDAAAPALPRPGPDTVRRQDLDAAHAERMALLESTPAALPRSRAFSSFEREEGLTVILEGPEEEVLWAIARRIEAKRLDLPTLPSTSMALIELANNPTVEFRHLVEQISNDPVLSSELLRTANSVLYATEEPVDTLHAAVVRIGLRALRSMIFSVSMRGTILRSGIFSDYAEEVWRQAHSVATTAKAIAPAVGVDPEKAFLIGLLQDIGKIALLAMLSKQVKDQRLCTPALVGRVFQVYHQEAGAAMARKWRLPAEFVAVCGCHHELDEDGEHVRSAALANVAHHLDLALELRDEALWKRAGELPALRLLAPRAEVRQRVLELARQAHAQPALAAAPSTAPAASAESAGTTGIR